MTDAASTKGDVYKKAGERAEADIHLPAFDDSLGRLLTGLWPTDTPSGTAPTRTHAFTGLGSAPAFYTMWSLPGGSLVLPESFGKGLCAGMSFSSDQNGSPLDVGYKFVGQVPAVVSAPTITNTDSMATTYFRAVGATLKFDEASGTPVAHTNIQSFTLEVVRDVTPVATADGVNVAYLAQGLVDFNLTLSLIWSDWLAYRATFYGATGGSAASATIVAGSVELNWIAVGPNSATSTFKLSVPKVALLADAPEPNPDASPLTVTINAKVLKPASGDHVVPTLVNNVTAAY